MIGLDAYLILAAALFFIGAAGFVARRNLFVLLMSIELMLNGVNLALLAFSRSWMLIDGQIMVLMVVAVAAAEAALALALVVLVFRSKETLDVDVFRQLEE